MSSLFEMFRFFFRDKSSLGAKVRSLDLFDYRFYRETYLHGTETYEECLQHYLAEGSKQFYKPHWLIDPLFLVRSGRIKNAVYLLEELTENIDNIDTCHPIFDATFYCEKNRLPANGYSSPFVHYLKQGASRNFTPSMWFDPAYYFTSNPDLDAQSTIAVRQFLIGCLADSENKRGKHSPTWWFNTDYYLRSWDVEPYADPLVHLVLENPERRGINYLFDRLSEHRSLVDMTAANLASLAAELVTEFPRELKPVFQPEHYLEANTDLRKGAVNPVKHFVAHGVLESRVHLTYPPLDGICIVTPDVLGPVKNGGIGTACFNYAVSSAKAGHATFVLYTGNIEPTELSRIERLFKENGVRFDYIFRVERMPRRTWGSMRELDVSVLVSRFLRRQNFDRVFFQDWKANGFWSFREKFLGRAFRNTHFSVICHSPSQWHDEGMRIFPPNWSAAAKIRWAERECIRNADSIVCPSQHMENWLRSNGYLGDCPIYRAPYTYNQTSEPRPAPTSSFVFAFFGRLEKRKGLDIFLEAISLLPTAEKRQIKKLLFLGKFARVDGVDSELLLQAFMEETDMNVEIHSDLDATEAISRLKQENAVAVAPSIADNLPLVVIECIAHQIPLLASSVGGIPEMIPESALFEPTPENLAAAISRTIRNGVPVCEPLWTADSAQSTWLNLLSSLKPRPGQKDPRPDPTDVPEVSVCVPNYNHCRYLPSLMVSLAQQTQVPKRVIVVDDGSTLPETEDALKNLEKRNWPFELHIIRSRNAGPGHARNLAAKAADTPLLCFIDADNVPRPPAIESMRDALLHANLDAVFGAYEIYESDALILDPNEAEGIYLPLGDYTGSALTQNDMGDSFLMIRSETFFSLDGFDDAPAAHEDWMFSLRLNISGARVSSMCEPLLSYRRTAESRSRQMGEFDHYKSLQALVGSAPGEISRGWVEQLTWQSYNMRSGRR